VRWLLALLALFALTGARDPILVSDVSQHEVQVRQGFHGADLLLFGAILDPQGTRAGRDYDIVVVLKGPTRPVLLRQKERVAGIWLNADSTEFHSVPTYFAVASSRPIEQIVNDKTASIYELGLPSLQLSPTGTIDPEAVQRFAAGLVDLQSRKGLYREDQHGVRLSEQVLYQARITLPANVKVGTYTAEAFAISRGRVVATSISEVEVRKLGFEGAVANFARYHAFVYGLMAVALSVLMGWLAGRVFALV